MPPAEAMARSRAASGARVIYLLSEHGLLTQVQFQAPQSRYPTRGVALLRNGEVWLREAVSQVGGGTVRSAGRLPADLAADPGVEVVEAAPVRSHGASWGEVLR